MELSIEEKAKAYDESKARMKVAWDSNRCTLGFMNEIFPELKESKDEKIRKAIYNALKYLESEQSWDFLDDVDILDAYAWLEKQDSHYTFEIKRGYWYKCTCDYMPNGSDLFFKHNRLYYCSRDWRLESEIDERNVKDIGVNGYKSFFRPATNQEIKDWLDKQGEQEPIIDISKFKVGDWITNDTNGVWKIVGKLNNFYILEDQYGAESRPTTTWVDEHYRLWNIKDAKVGDILCLNDEVFIYAYKKQGYNIVRAYCYVDSVSRFYIEGDFVYTEKGNSIHPATKRQCNTLMLAITKAGYVWNITKKNLIKL